MLLNTLHSGVEAEPKRTTGPKYPYPNYGDRCPTQSNLPSVDPVIVVLDDTAEAPIGGGSSADSRVVVMTHSHRSWRTLI